MTISVKSRNEIEAMKKAGRIAALARNAAGALVAPGVTTAEINAEVERVLAENGAAASFLGYNGYPASACISINDEVIHGIPGKRKIRDGDLVKIDVGAIVGGYHGDTAATFAAGTATAEARRLAEIAEKCFYDGVKFAVAGNRISDISFAVQCTAENEGFSVVRVFTGHGIGTKLHEEPSIPNFGPPGHGPRLVPGMTICIEPMINAGVADVFIERDGWTIRTKDGGLSAHYEHTVLITDREPELLTEVPYGNRTNNWRTEA